MSTLSLASNNLTFIDNTTINFTGLCDKTKVDLSTDKTFTEEVINDFIILPNGKTPIKQINSIDVKTTILNYKVVATPGGSGAFIKNNENKRITGKNIFLSGVICLDINYTGTDAASTVDTFKGKLPFTSYIVVPKTTNLSDKFDISCCVPKINIISIENYKIINASSAITLSAKKIINPILSVDNACSCSSSNPLTTTGIVDSSILTTAVTNSDKIWNEVSFSKNLILPTNLPDAKSVSSIASSIKIISQKIISTPKSVANQTNYYGQSLLGKKLIIEGMLKQRITYTATNTENTSHSFIINLPISCYIVIPNTINLDQKFKITAYIEYLHSCCINERTLFSGSILFFKAQSIDASTCISIKANLSGFKCPKDFSFNYNMDGLCNLSKIQPLPLRSTWNEAIVYERINLSSNAPISFIQNISTSLKITSTDLVENPTSKTQYSIEGFLLDGLVCVVNGYLITTVTYNSSNTSGSVISKEVLISFSEFIVLIEAPTASDELVITPCLENVFATVLDETGIGVSAQIFLNAKIVNKA